MLLHKGVLIWWKNIVDVGILYFPDGYAPHREILVSSSEIVLVLCYMVTWKDR